ncbi:MATE family efflux transporter [Polycladidibacter stylochi]|uniref:MATE family efflux transporter n=1 Tax=Polycladidibacter stylochi TaxID=1807766 RepID=UPI00082E3FEB|nr:MATE family efflux transporter [Pseudovibrio stylochi]
MTPVDKTSATDSSALWLQEGKATLLLGVPLIGAQLAQMAINFTDTLMIGWLGAKELAASVIALQLFFIVFLAGLGVLQAVMPLASRAVGQGDVRGVRRASRMGIWVALSYTTVAMLVLWHGEQIFVLVGQDPEVSKIAASYLQIVQWSMYPGLLVVAIRCFLTSIERAQVVLWATVASALLNAIFDYLLIFGHYGFPKLGILGAGIASVATATFSSLILIGYVYIDPRSRQYELFVRIWRADWNAFAEIWRLGLPIALTIVAEVGLFVAAAFMMGWIGTIELAAHGIAGQLSGIAYMIPLGLSNAAVVRVGHAVGRNDPMAIKRSGWVAIGLGGCIAALGALLFLAAPETLIGFYLDPSNPEAAQVMKIGVPLVFIAAVFMVFDSIQGVAAGVLRGMSDTKMPMLIAVCGYWVVGIGSSYVLAFVYDWGPEGIWWGLANGLAFSSVFLLSRFIRRDKLNLIKP